MPIDRAFILAAGKGTRMGEIGKELPKVLWPLFNSTLLGLQIEFLKELGVKRIAINSHHLHEKMCEYIEENYSDVTVLHEPELLDAGGGVHNYLRQTNYNEVTFIMNSDQFLELQQDDLVQLQQKLNDGRLTLLAMDNPGGFSGLKTKDNQLIEIGGDEFPMYVGLALLNPKDLTPVEGVSKFFSSVGNYQKEKVTVHYSKGSYIDFGTTKHYAQTCFEILKRTQASKSVRDFFIKHGIIRSELINTQLNAYNCDQKNVLNFSQHALKHTWPEGSVIIEEGNSLAQSRCVVYRDKAVEY